MTINTSMTYLKIFLVFAFTFLSIKAASWHKCKSPKFPHDFKFSYHGPVNGWTCIKIVEPSDHIWKKGHNYFCHLAGPQYRGVGFRWSYAGKS